MFGNLYYRQPPPPPPHQLSIIFLHIQQIRTRLKMLPDMLRILNHTSCVDILWKTIKQMDRLEESAGEPLGADEVDMIMSVFVRRSREIM